MPTVTNRYGYGPSLLGGLPYDTADRNGVGLNRTPALQSLYSAFMPYAPQMVAPIMQSRPPDSKLSGAKETGHLGEIKDAIESAGWDGAKDSPGNVAAAGLGALAQGSMSPQAANLTSKAIGMMANMNGLPGGLIGSVAKGVLSGNMAAQAPSIAGGLVNLGMPGYGRLGSAAVNAFQGKTASAMGDVGGFLGARAAGPLGGLLGTVAGSYLGGAPAAALAAPAMNGVLAGLGPLGMLASAMDIGRMTFGTYSPAVGENIGGLLGTPLGQSIQNSVDAAPSGWGYGWGGGIGSRVGSDGVSDTTSRGEAGLSGRSPDTSTGDISGNDGPSDAGNDADSDPSDAAKGEAGDGGEGYGSGGFGGDSDGDGGDGGGGGGGGGGRVICTHFFRKGQMPRDWWRADLEWTAKHCSATTVRGYHYWAIPYVKWMRRSSFAEAVMRPIALTRAKELAYQMGQSEKGSYAGKLVRWVLEPLSFLIGLVVEQKDWKHLYEGEKHVG